MTTRRRLGALAAAVAFAAALSGCSSAGSGPPASTSTAPSSTAGSGTTATSTTTLPSAARSRAQIAAAYSTLFDLASPAVPPKLAVVQGGAHLRGAFVKALHSPLAKLAGGARIQATKIEKGSACAAETLPSPCAAVDYEILSPKGKVILANSKGFAVYAPPRWLVSKGTICALLTLDNGSVAPPGC